METGENRYINICTGTEIHHHHDNRVRLPIPLNLCYAMLLLLLLLTLRFRRYCDEDLRKYSPLEICKEGVQSRIPALIFIMAAREQFE